jgi:hypothetical protein
VEGAGLQVEVQGAELAQVGGQNQVPGSQMEGAREQLRGAICGAKMEPGSEQAYIMARWWRGPQPPTLSAAGPAVQGAAYGHGGMH